MRKRVIEVISTGPEPDGSIHLSADEIDWHRISTRATREARAGAPAGMVAFYVTVEVEHLRQGHEEPDAQTCDQCNEFAARFEVPR